MSCKLKKHVWMMDTFCPYRLGEVCSHVAALLFKIEAACKLGYNNPFCTSQPCLWNKSYVDKVE